MDINKRKILWGCGCFIVVAGCFFALLLGLLFWLLFPSQQLDMKNPTHKQLIEDNIGFQFPPSVKWKKGKFQPYPFDYDITCLFTLPERDIDVMFPPEKLVWHENDQIMLSELARRWLSKATLKDFKAARVDYTKDKNRSHGVLEIAIGNSGQPEVEVFVFYFSI
jgi:hypothetical protein